LFCAFVGVFFDRGVVHASVGWAFVLCCGVVDCSSKAEVARYTLSSQGSHTAQIMAKIYRHNGEWKMHAIGENGTGRTIENLLPQIAIHL